MARTHVTGAGDALDLICLREYGAQAGAVEKVLEANPQIAAVSHRLPIGVDIALPDITVTRAGARPKLWD